jgi:hypothetical protein
MSAIILLLFGSAGAGEGTGTGSTGYDLKTENGFFVLQEDGSYILTEDQPALGTGDGSAGFDLKLENGFFLLQEDGSYLLLEEQPAVAGTGYVKPPGGDDAPPRSHVGIPPKVIKDKPRKRATVERDELEALYDRIQGIKPQTKAAKKAIAAVQRAVAPSAIELPPASTLDWVSIEADLRAAIAIRRAYQIIQDEEDAVIALLLAA